MKKIAITKDDMLDVLKGVVFSVIICVVLILLFALIVKFTALSDSVIVPINIVIKVLSIFTGCLLGIKSASKGALKGLIIGALFMLITYLLFSLVNGSFTANSLTWIDALLMLAEGLISGIIVVNVKGRKA